MSNEIKEILDKLRETADYPKLNYSSYDKSYNETIDNVAMIKSFACKQLLDYITNLQQENERLKIKAKEQSLLLIDYQDMEQRYNDYKSRCEKAIEYICRKDMEANLKGNAEFKSKDLINILQNGSDSQ